MFAQKYTENIVNVSFAEFAQRMVKGKNIAPG